MQKNNKDIANPKKTFALIMVLVGIFTLLIVLSIICRDWLMNFLGIDKDNDGVQIYYEVIRNFILGLSAVVGLGVALWRTYISEKQTHTAEQSLQLEKDKATKQSQETRFYQALTQLSDENLSVRLSGIFTLSALKDEDDFSENGALYMRCMDVLCAFIRHPYNSKKITVPLPNNGSEKREIHILRSDVEEAVKQVTKRTDKQKQWEQDKKIEHNLRRAVLKHGNFENCDFSTMCCRYADFSYTYCYKANFTNTHCRKAKFANADCTYANFTKADCTYANFTKAYCREAAFTKAYCREAAFTKAYCLWTNFTNAYCTLANFTKADCRAAAFTNADCDRANFTKADCRAAAFTNADCDRANFTNADCDRANFTNANCNGAKFDGTILTGTIGLNLKNTEFAP